MLHQSDQCLKLTVHSPPKKRQPCVEDLEGTHACFYPQTLWPSSGHDCYITGTFQSPSVSLLNLHSLLTSAVEISNHIVLEDFWGYPTAPASCKQSQSHLITPKEFKSRRRQTIKLNLLTLICTRTPSQPGGGVSFKFKACAWTDVFHFKKKQWN